MKRWMAWLVLSVCVACGGADCITYRLAWSPDGEHLALTTSAGLLLSDRNGRLLESRLEGARLVQWFSDARRLLVVQVQPAPDWESARKGISPQRQRELIGLADRLRADLLSFEGEWKDFKPAVADDVTGGELPALILYVRDHRNQGLADKLGEKRWKELQKLSAALQVVQIHELSGEKLEPRAVIGTTVNGILEVRLSPTQKAVAIAEAMSDQVVRLAVAQTEPGEWREVARGTGIWPDWTPDGTSVVYGHCDPDRSDESLRLGTLSRRQVCAGDGRLLSEFGPAEDLAGLLFFPHMKVRCLRDGRIVFSTAEITLPTTEKEMPQRASLFAIDSARQPGVTRLIPRSAESNLPNGLEMGLFEVSPDHTQIAIVGSEPEGAGIAILALASGEVRWVIENVKDLYSQIPAWRGNQELSFVVPPGTPGGSQEDGAVAHWAADGGVRCLSCGWPVRIEKKDEPQPASSGAVD